MSEINEQLLERLRGNGVVREDEGVISIYDVMKRAGVGREASHVLQNLTHVIDFEYSFHKFPGQGSRFTPSIAICHLQRLLQALPGNGVRKFLYNLEITRPMRRCVPTTRPARTEQHKHFYIRTFPNDAFIKIGITKDLDARHTSYGTDDGQMLYWIKFANSDICVATHIEKILKTMFTYMTVNSRNEYLDLKQLSDHYGVDTADEVSLCILAEVVRLQSRFHPQVKVTCFQCNDGVQIQPPIIT